MAPEIRSHIQHESLMNAGINFLINAGLAWWLMQEHGPLAWWGKHGFAQDMLITAVLLTFIVGMIMILMHRKKVRDGKLPALQLDSSQMLHRLLARMPQSAFASALLFVLCAIALFIPVMFVIFKIAGVETLTVMQYALIKGAWAGVLAATMVIPMIMFGLRAEMSR